MTRNTQSPLWRKEVAGAPGALDARALDILFRNARSHNGWTAHDVETETLHAIHDLARMGPTSMNCCPMRIVFVRSPEEKTRLLPSISEGNREKIRTAPVVAIIGTDYRFYDALPRLFPHRPVREIFRADPALAAQTAARNGTLQGAYLMFAARALGLDCGPMSGFDAGAVDSLYFAGTPIRTNFLCGLGRGDPDKLYPRLPRFDFDDVCRIL